MTPNGIGAPFLTKTLPPSSLGFRRLSPLQCQSLLQDSLISVDTSVWPFMVLSWIPLTRSTIFDHSFAGLGVILQSSELVFWCSILLVLCLERSLFDLFGSSFRALLASSSAA
ncbi:hypothetical protein BC827DRAFT_1266981 [Russula dissimulans]|nr:hypothetical protein BC827DRAFT_1266981 [Russula dissimulans]